MPGIPVNFQLGQFPSGYCFQSLQSFANDLINLLTGTVSGNFSGVVIGPNLPTVTQQSNLWIKTDALGNPIGPFLFGGGQWIWRNTRQPSPSPERMIWAGTELALWSYDGGDGTDPVANPPTPTTGAMWSVDHSLDFKIPMGAGTNGTTYNGNPATVLAQGATLGEEQHALILAENTPHRHAIGKAGADRHEIYVESGGVVTPGIPGFNPGGSGDVAPADVVDVNAAGPFPFQTDNPAISTIGTTTTAAHNTLPPVVGVFFAKRTARQFYTAS